MNRTDNIAVNFESEPARFDPPTIDEGDSIYGTLIEAEETRNEQVTKLDLSMPYHPHPAPMGLINVDFLVYFPNLISLDLNHQYNLGDNYYVISRLTKLRKLNIGGISITTLTPLRSLTNLTSLDLSGRNDRLQSVNDLLVLKKLRHLILRGQCYLQDIHRLSALTTLVKLNLNGVFDHYYNEGDYYEEPTLHFLMSLVNLKRLELGANDYLREIDPITYLPKLTYLSLSGSHNIWDFHSLERLTTLKTLDVGGTNIEMRTTNNPNYLRFLMNLPRLENLTISQNAHVDFLFEKEGLTLMMY